MSESTITVLAVDDQDTNLRLLEAVLTPRGYRVVPVGSGAQALEVLATEPVDLVLLDILMPGMDGYEVCRRIRDDEATAYLPVIMLTASGAQQRLDALEAGADDFVTKPYEPDHMRFLVQRILERRRLIDELRQLRKQMSEDYSFHNIVSPKLVGFDDNVMDVHPSRFMSKTE